MRKVVDGGLKVCLGIEGNVHEMRGAGDRVNRPEKRTGDEMAVGRGNGLFLAGKIDSEKMHECGQKSGVREKGWSIYFDAFRLENKGCEERVKFRSDREEREETFFEGRCEKGYENAGKKRVDNEW